MEAEAAAAAAAELPEDVAAAAAAEAALPAAATAVATAEDEAPYPAIPNCCHFHIFASVSLVSLDSDQAASRLTAHHWYSMQKARVRCWITSSGLITVCYVCM